VWLGVGQALDLGNVEVGVDVYALVLSISVVCQDTSAGLEVRYNKLSFVVRFVYSGSAHGVDKNRNKSGLLESSLETPQNRFGPLKVVGICL
jgi:hypothetical protein